MPSAFAHATVGASFAAALPLSSRPIWVPIALALVAAAPDLDVIAFRFGIPYEHILGHRGLSHSLFFAALVGVASLPLWRIAKIERARLAATLTFFAVASHGLLDTFTDAGLGVALFAPFTDARYFSPFRPLMTSPLSARAFFSAHGLSILGNELIWIGPVALLAGLGGLLARRMASARA
jgi:inner membrane protein